MIESVGEHALGWWRRLYAEDPERFYKLRDRRQVEKQKARDEEPF